MRKDREYSKRKKYLILERKKLELERKQINRLFQNLRIREQNRPMVFTVKKKHRNDKYWHSLDNGDLKEWF